MNFIDEMRDPSNNLKVHKWDSRFLQLCDLVASWSEDPSRKVGAVVVGSANVVVSTGYNGLARSLSAEASDRLDRENGDKYYWMEHAERNAIYNAARLGVSLAGCRIYTTLFPCADCARAIIQSGINELVTAEIPPNEARFSKSMQISREMLLEAGIELRYLTR